MVGFFRFDLDSQRLDPSGVAAPKGSGIRTRRQVPGVTESLVHEFLEVGLGV